MSAVPRLGTGVTHIAAWLETHGRNTSRASDRRADVHARREYLSVEQLAERTPWSADAIRRMVTRGQLHRDVHYFQPLGRTTQLIFKWSAIVAFIEGERVEERHAAPITDPGGETVVQAERALRRMLSRT
jgi:hypothetical protein